ncbi:MAG: hypothetical protein BGO67_10695 [Alphaproteobacteria bacterium 41-28]|nr:MAG: hypothetical protein BGO67_10695 [Alphaproteobacteria bacterium 41-28]
MKKNLKLLILFPVVVLAFLVTQVLSSQAMEEREDPTEYHGLPIQEQEILFTGCRLKHAVNFTATSPEDAKFDLSSQQSVTWTQDPDWAYPEQNLVEYQGYFFSKAYSELKKTTTKDVHGNAKFLGIELNTAKYNSKKESLKKNEKTEVYLLAQYIVPKIELSIPLDHITTTNQFKQAIEGVVGNSDTTLNIHIDSYRSLLNILNDYGLYLPTRFVLGGQIFSENKKTVHSVEQANSAAHSWGVSLKVAIKTFDASVGGEKSSETSNVVKLEEIQHNITKTVIGGDVAKSNDSTQWMASLSPCKSWRVIERGGFCLIIDFLESNLRDRCKALIRHFFNVEERSWSIPGMRRITDAYDSFPLKREPIIGICIDQCKLLGLLDLSYLKLGNCLNKVVEIYQGRMIDYKSDGILDQAVEEILAQARPLASLQQSYRGLHYWGKVQNYTLKDWGKSTEINKLRGLLIKDVIESMVIYRGVYGRQHPRWDEAKQL